MSAAELIERARTEGVTLALSGAGKLKVAGDRAALERWLPALRARKPDLLAALQRAERRRHWLIITAANDQHEVFVTPDATRAEVEALYGGSATPAPAEPLPPAAALSTEQQARALIAAVARRRGWSGADEAETMAMWRAEPAEVEAGLRHLLTLEGTHAAR